MAGEIYFKSGSKSSITTQAPLTPSYKAGTVYFAVDNTDNGFIYLDYNNKRIPMTAVASKDSANNSIISTYMASVSFDSNSSSLIFKDGNNDTHSTVLLPFLLLTGGNVTGPVNFGDSVTTDELTAGSLIVNGVARFNNGLIGNLTGNADTATSAISATKDSSNHKIVDYYVHSIAHSNNTINYSNGNGDSLGSFAIPGAFFVKGTQTSSTNAWTGALPSGVTQYYEGLSIAYFLPYAGTSTAATLNLGGLGAKPIIIGENATSAATTHYDAKNVIWMTYLTDSSINSGNGYWKVSAHRNSTYYYTTAYCTTGAGTAAKAGNVSYYTLQPGYIPVMFSYDNTAQSALTLNINSTGAKPLYINGVASSSSNYTIPKDVYMVYYDGTNYYLRTDGVLPGKMERAVADGSGNNIQSTYANSLTLSGSTLTLKNKNGDKLSEVTIAASDTKVNVTLGTTTKAYILGTSTTPTGTATGVTSIADTGVYLGTTAGELVATKFTGDLAGNATSATSATSATNDSANHKITDHYVHSITTSSNTLTYKDGDGDQLGTASLVNSVSNTWAAGTTSGPKITTTVNGVDGTAVAIPSASASESGVVTTGAQTFAGSKTFNSKIIGNLQGNADSATKATNDGGGNEIESTYIKAISYSGNSSTNAAGSSITAGSAGLVTMTKGDDTTSKIDIPAATASIAGLVNNGAQTFAGTKTFSTGVTIASGTSTKAVFNYSDIQAGTSDAARPVWFAWAGQNGTPVIDTDFTYNPSTNTVKADKFDGLATKATGDSNGNNILSTYANSLTLSGNTLTLKNKNGDKLSEVTIAASDTKVNVTLGTTSKAYILGTTTTPTSTATGVTSIADTGVYLGTTAGELVATKFTGDLNGNAATATLASKATGDGNGNEIISKYASSLEASGTTLTLKAQNGDTLSTVTTQDTKNTAGSSQKATKIYIIGAESQATSAQTYSSSKVYITDGTVTATTFSGDLSGNATSATTATSATNDSANHKITDHYVHSITTSSNTLTYKDGDGDQLGTASLVNSVSNTWAAGTTAGPTIKTTVNGVDGTAVAIPSAGASASGIVTTGAQTFAGSKTFSSKIIGDLQGNADTATKATNDSGNHKILDWYVHSISFDSSTSKLTYTDGDGDSTDILLPFLLLSGGNVTGPVSFGDSVSIDALTVGSLVSTGVATFNNGLIGNLTGNADTATKATQDSSGNNILNFYAHSLTSSGNTLTLKNGNGDSLSTPSIVNSISNTWTDGTSAGPTIKTTVNGISGTAVAIPSASASVSGAVTTGAQTFAGIKTFANNIVVAKASGAPDPASTPVTYTNRNSFPSITFNSNGQYGSFIMTEYDSAFKPGVNLFFRSDTGAGNIIATYLKAEEGFYAKFANTLITGGTYTAAVTTSPYAPEKWTFNTTVSPANGDIITIETPGGGHDYGVFLSVKDGDYYPIVLNGTGRLTTHYPQGTLLTLIFDSDQSATSIFPLGGGTARTTVTGGAWRVLNYYDSGNPGDWNLRQYNILAKTAITAVHAIGGTDSGYNKIDTGTPFDIRYAVMYAASDIAAGAAGSNNFVHHYSVNLRNSSNSNITFTAYKNIYIKGTISGTTFTPYSTTNPYVQDITAAEDGYVYYYIGRAYSTSAMTFDTTGRDIFIFRNGAIRKYSGHSESTDSINAYSVGSMNGKTITDLKTALSNFISNSNSYKMIHGYFNGSNWKTLWNGTDTTTTMASSSNTYVQNIAPYSNNQYAQLLISSYYDNELYLAAKSSNSWSYLRKILTSIVGTAIGSTSKPVYIDSNGTVTALSASVGSTYVPVFLNSGTISVCTSPSILVNLGSTSATNVFAASPRPGVTGVLPVANGGTGRSSWTANQLVYSSASTTLINTPGLSYFSGNSTAATPATYTRLHINGTTYGNTAANMISGTAGLFSFGDGGPQITFDTSATPGGGQAGALIFTDHDTAGTGASWHFVSNQGDWTVTSKRFHARTSISIGTDLPVTSDTLYINGTTLTTNNISRTAASLGTSWIGSRDKAVINVDASDSTSSTAFSLARIKFSTKTYAIGSERAGNAFGIYGWNNSRTENGTDWAFYIGNDTYFRCTTRLYGAVWNDYAEYRISKEKEPGRCVREVGDDTLVLTTERLQLGCEIVSDTFGFAIGQTEKADTPIASNGRVLAYPLEDREEFKNHIGEPVCSGPNGTISIMTKEEIKEYPHCIIGTISAVPDYEEWGTENIKVNGRIWIRIR